MSVLLFCGWWCLTVVVRYAGKAGARGPGWSVLVDAHSPGAVSIAHQDQLVASAVDRDPIAAGRGDDQLGTQPLGQLVDIVVLLANRVSQAGIVEGLVRLVVAAQGDEFADVHGVDVVHIVLLFCGWWCLKVVVRP